MSEKAQFDGLRYIKLEGHYYLHLSDLHKYLKGWPNRLWEKLSNELGDWLVQVVHNKKDKK